MDLPHFTLNNGHKVPAVGLGTFQGDSGNSVVKSVVLTALHLGYRHIDGASAYGNEKEIGEAIKESRVPREEIFVTTKLAQTWHEPADVERALELSLKNLQLDYVDLYLMHFPHAYRAGEGNTTIRHPSGNGKPVIDYDLSRRYPETWQAMESLVDSGKARSIGLSNFNILKTKRILDVARIVPAVNQVELHPYLPQHELLEFSRQNGILLMAHQPLGGRPVAVVRGHSDMPFPTEDTIVPLPKLIALYFIPFVNSEKVVRIAEELGITPAQVCLAWAVQRGVPVIPKSNKESHMKENLHLPRLPEDKFRIIDELSDRQGPIRFLDPCQHLGFDIFDEENDQPGVNSAPWD